ncbi:GCN5-related N-acetyltransferase [Klebsiella pneumoniae]|uniref:GCN5-related N-acetyltransferase n=1 Tax=Klebsiella pneumoniae TaxID=573 RepID=A0A2X3BVY6_KLEPN|nr:GCN5-related N-acetyltransferase [Klebsiella pneumoniae]
MGHAAVGARAGLCAASAGFLPRAGLFADDDRDEIDDHAHLLVALGCVAGWHDRVVGTVRIHQQSPGVWLGRGWRWTPPIAARGSWGRR